MTLNVSIDAILFDLDGVLTDTAEAHFQAWKRLADEEGIPFTREDNERLRGVSRRESLRRMLKGREIDEETAQAWMARKNGYYQELLEDFSPDDILPGVLDLLDETEAAGVEMAVVSASRNAGTVVDKLEIRDRFGALVTGADPGRPKPEPDIFLLAARRLGVSPAACIVVEDAASGVDAAKAAGMVSVGLGPEERVGHADLVLPDLSEAHIDDLLRAETWRIAESHFEQESQHHHETVLTIGNGSLGTRGTLEEEMPGERQATLVHGVWDDAPLVYTELANVPDWTALDLWIDGQQLRMDEGKVEDYVRYLDLRTGELHRRLRWTPPTGTPVELRFTRLARLDDGHSLGLRVQVTPLEESAHVRMRARLNGHVENEGLLHLRPVDQGHEDGLVHLTVETRHTGKHVCQVMGLAQHGVQAEPEPLDCPLEPGVVIESELDVNQSWTVDKIVALYADRNAEDEQERASAKANNLLADGFDAMRAANAAAWRKFWDDSDVIIEGDREAQTAVRHALFQLRIAAPAQDEHASIGAKALSGFGYYGHVFWDTEIFMLPFFIYTQPELARNLLMYRWHTLAGARLNARRDDYDGARYPWESAETGEEVTPRFLPDPSGEKLERIWTGDLELHVTCDVAFALWHYWQISGDDDFMQDVGARIVLETARFWESRVEEDAEVPGRYEITNVIGPDEYHDHVDNNVFTNRMVAWHLRTALEVLDWLDQVAEAQSSSLRAELALNESRLRKWREIADNLVILYDPETKLYEQFEGFFALPEVDWEAHADRTKPIQEVLGIEETNRRQALKQPDVLLMFCLLPHEVTHEEWQANWDYYAPRTDHRYGSSLGPATHAWAACELGRLDEAYTHFMRAARADLADVRGNAGAGIHAASAGALWQALVFGFAGVRTEAGEPTAEARLPSGWQRLAFRLRYRGEPYDIDLRSGCPD